MKMVDSIMIAPPYSIIFIMDPSCKDTPIELNPLITATEFCVIVSCLCFSDGATSITLGKKTELDPGVPPAYQGEIKTPSSVIVVKTAENETILEIPVAGSQSHVWVWTNDTREPERIIIGVE